MTNQTPFKKQLAAAVAIAIVLIVGYRWLAANTEPRECEFYKPLAGLNNENFVATPAKLGLNLDGWSVRENVIFTDGHKDDAHYLGSRGFEFRWEHTPENTNDHHAEMHTTINLYDSSDYVAGFEREGEQVSEYGWLTHSDDGDNTWKVTFYVGQFQGSVKVKLMADEEARPLVIEAADLVVGELLTTCEANN